MKGSAAGTVYLVGAGPGDPGLITMRGAECLRRADVVVYDRLAHPDLLRHASPSAEVVYVGKAAAQHSKTQDEINAILLDRALQGKTVCRLKGGDPFVFGRGGEEAEACRGAGVPFEIVPGVTSAIAAPAYAGIPITHRDASSSFAVITGHERDDQRGSGIREAGVAEGRRDWSRIAWAADTLVFLMGVESLGEIQARLLEHGRDPKTPVALVRWGTWSRQETLVSTLGEVVEEVRSRGFKAPAVTVIGEVVRLRETLRWFDTRPLFGKRVVVTRAREQASALSDLLREMGAEPVEFPVIRIAPMADHSALDAALGRLQEFSWVVYTSANGVNAAQARLEAAGLDSRAFGNARVAAIGDATTEALKPIGIRPDFVPSRFVAEIAAEEWPDKELTGKSVLFPTAKDARELLPEALRSKGALVEVVTAYETVMDNSKADEMRTQLAAGELDAVTFTSSSTVKNFVESVGAEHVAELLKNVTVASIGPITSQTARELGLRVDVEASEFTVPGLVEALARHFRAGGEEA